MKTKSLVLIAIVAFGLNCGVRAAEATHAIPAAALDTPAEEAKGREVAVLAGGCFWGMQGVFQHVKGVSKVVAGYSGGEKSTANYEAVSTETTGHAESVEVTFDPKVVSYGQILRIYFSVAHDPTQLNRQGPDRGPSYRSEIFYASPTQERIARAYVAQLTNAKSYPGPIVTKIEPLKAFFAAEDYHQDYLFRNPTQPYIAFNDLPKIEALKRTFPQMYQERPVLLRAAR